jgi:hypothetical protein
VLRPGGFVVITARPWRRNGVPVDFPAAVTTTAEDAGLDEPSRPIHGSRRMTSIPRSSAGGATRSVSTFARAALLDQVERQGWDGSDGCDGSYSSTSTMLSAAHWTWAQVWQTAAKTDAPAPSPCGRRDRPVSASRGDTPGVRRIAQQICAAGCNQVRQDCSVHP